MFSIKIDDHRTGYIDAEELGRALEAVGIRIPGYEVRQLIEAGGSNIKDGKIDIEDFKNVGFKFEFIYTI